MSQYGSIILKYRKQLNLTQADLAKLLFVSPQAVSKWEKNLSEPDLSTLKKMVDIFGITLDQFFIEEKEKAASIETETNTQYMCDVCGHSFDEKQMFALRPKAVCQSCHQKLEEEDAFFKNYEQNKKHKSQKRKQTQFAYFMTAGGIGFALFVLFIVSYLVSNESEIPFIGYFFSSLLISFIFTAFLTQMLYDSWLRSFVGNFFGRSIRMPGIIFELSIDGFIMLIIVKVLFGLVMLLIGLLIFCVGLLLALGIAPFTYIVEIIKKIIEVKQDGV